MHFFGLKPNLKKSEIVGIGTLKGFQVAVYSLRCIDLNNDTLKSSFLLQWKIKSGKIFYKIVTNKQWVLNIWEMRNLPLQGKIVIFKTIPISKIVFQLFIRTIPRHIINKIEEI